MSLNSRPAPVPFPYTTLFRSAHLQGTRLAALWPRVFARLIDSLIFSLVIGAASGAVIFFGIGNQSNRTPFWISLGVSIALTVLLCIGYLVALMRSGQTPGLRILGLAWAGFKNSGPPRGAAFNKLALQLGVSLVTAGIGNLVIYALSRDHLNRFWFDRASGVIVLNVRQGVNPVRLQSNPLTLPNQPFAPQTGPGAGDMDEFGLHPQLPGVQAAAQMAQNSFTMPPVGQGIWTSSGCTRSYLEYRQRHRWPKTLSPCPQPQAQMVLLTPALALLVAPQALALALLVA